MVEVLEKEPDDGLEGEEVIDGLEVIEELEVIEGAADVIEGWLLGYSWERMFPKSSGLIFWELSYFTLGVGAGVSVGGLDEAAEA
mgnify:CR=1 FL=1